MKLAFSLAAGVVILLLYHAIAHSSSFSPQQVCRATIATIMGRDPAIIKVYRTDEESVHVTYVRPDDGVIWSQRCRFEGHRVIWASPTGRWRTLPEDGVLTFSSSGDTLTINERFSDGSSRSKTFTRSQLQD